MKKFLSMLLVVAMALSMVVTASASSLAGTYDITVWCASEIVDLTKAQIDEFNKTNANGIVFNATVEAVSEADAATNMTTDVTAGADIYCFAQDQFARLAQSGALAKLGTGAAKFVTDNNDAGSVESATLGDALYAYPLTSDNGYFMYYDKSVISEENIDSLEALIAECEAKGKYFAFEMGTSAWYAASFFFGTGCVSEWDYENKEFTGVTDTFNSAQGLIAAKGMEKLVKSKAHLSSAEASEFESNAAIVVTGTWGYKTAQGILGENMGVADLPSFEVDGVNYHIGSFRGYKLLGVKPQDGDPVKQAVLHQLAQYLTNEKCQLERFYQNSFGPSNLVAQQNADVIAHPALAALRAQLPYSVLQGQIHGSWWDIAKVIADDVKAATDEAGLQTALDNYSNKISSLFNMSSEQKNAFTVIGTVNGTSWNEDFAMIKNAEGKWLSAAYQMDAGTEFKVRQGLSWDVAYPAANFVVETAGTYIVQLDEATGEVTLIAQ